MLWLRQAVARQRGSGLSQRPEGGYGDQLPQHGKSYPVKTGAGREASPEQAAGPPKPLTPARGSRQSGMRLPPQLPMGLPRAPPPSAQGGGGRGAVCSGSEHSLGLWVLLGRLEARSSWSVQVVGGKALGPGWTPAVRPPCGGQGGGLRGSSAPTASRSPTHSHLGRTPGTRGSGRSVGAECGGSAQGIVGESPPASRPCEEGPVQALELHPSARPPTSGQERAHPALSSEWTNKAAQLNVNNMFAQSLRWNAHAGLTQLGSGRAVERGLRVRERRAGGPLHTRPRSWGRPRAGA